jgi:NADH-quinone oxidoreductase subunit H
MASIQRRRGPNVVGFWGLLQPIADGVKLIIKELVIPSRSNPRIFVLAPLFILILSFVSWSVIPFGLAEILEKSNSYILYKNSSRIPHTVNFIGLLEWLPYLNENNKVTKIIQWWPNFSEYSSVANISYGVLFILAISSLNVYGIILGGWASNSKYAFLGALRSAAQMISYEVSLGLVILPVIMLSGSLNFTEIVVAQQRTGWYVFPLLPCAIIFIISMIAETNRAPFDLPEAEAELVAGYNVEYSSFTFAMFFLGEYSNMLLMATIATILFLGGWYAPFEFFSFIPTSVIFSIKIIFFCFLYVLVRATLPRYRYDQLMDIGWKIFLPITFGYLIFIASILVTFNAALFNLEVHLPIYTENILHEIVEPIEKEINFDAPLLKELVCNMLFPNPLNSINDIEYITFESTYKEYVICSKEIMRSVDEFLQFIEYCIDVDNKEKMATEYYAALLDADISICDLHNWHLV